MKNMKKLYLLSIVLSLAFSSCFEDEGNYKYTDVEEIEIEPFQELYTVLSYAGDKLEIAPVINTTYTDLEYGWYIWDRSKLEGAVPEGTEMELISSERNLSYEMNLPAGRYRLLYKVTSKKNGYSAITQTNFDVTTELSRGFYILKETADGNTDIDLYYKEGEPVMQDLFQNLGYGTLPGKPISLSSLYGMGYINKEDNGIYKAHAVSVTTDAGLIRMYNASDLSLIHDNSDVLYGGMANEEIPYATCSFGFGNFLISSRGCDASYTSDMMDGSGAFANASGNGGSPFMMLEGVYSVYYWSNEAHRLDYADQYSLKQDFFGAFDTGEISTEGMDCLACGSTLITSPVYGYCVLKDRLEARYLYVANLTFNKAEKLLPLEANSKMARATCYSVNAKTANYLYFVTDNKLYTYNLSDFTEAQDPIALEGIGTGEKITYLSYQWMNAPITDAPHSFTHLVVGTQNGDNYKIYMYDIVAGEPRNLVRTITGKGILKMTMYMSPNLNIYEGPGDDISLPN